ncbi:carbohydrate ABC transporter permease [Kineosporia sp. J2-2]|uniref:Carbohydrate ABC transporter permease n=1 Tax=Kineosporia corallincola TaxID=2835133 RepID=A0ABS5TSP8_9ACTN|nr:carbohydrate ABC transporter permease [Kineosporia corallincola]MBT0773846.1 carbohydrate ABC transporter permease [Kineosporia corallincola]
MTTATVDASAAGDREIVVYKKGFNWGGLGNGAAIVVIVFWCLAPFYWMAVLAFRDNANTFDNTPWFTHVTLDNFRYAFDTEFNAFGRSLLNSMVISVSVTVLSMLIAVFAGYALSRLVFRGKSIVLALILGASMFPGVAILTPIFQLFSDFGWLGTYHGLILPQVSFALPLAVYTLTSFFADMPWELEEAAKVDGCTPLQAFRKVIIPLAAPAMFTTAILVFLASWNEYLLSSVLSKGDTAVAPSTVAIVNFTAGPHIVPYTQTMAAGVIVTVPLVIVVLVFQRRIVSGLTAGGIKG